MKMLNSATGINLLNSPLLQGNKETKMLSDWLGTPQFFELVYRASWHGFSGKKFHEHCDGIPNTLVLIRTEQGKTLGGFTTPPWNSDKKWMPDPDLKSFLFSIDEGMKFPLKADKHK